MFAAMSSIDPLAGLRTVAYWPKPTTAEPVAQSPGYPATVIAWKKGLLTVSTDTTVGAYLAALNARLYRPGIILQATA